MPLDSGSCGEHFSCLWASVGPGFHVNSSRENDVSDVTKRRSDRCSGWAGVRRRFEVRAERLARRVREVHDASGGLTDIGDSGAR